MIQPCGILPGEGGDGGVVGTDKVSEESGVRDSGGRVTGKGRGRRSPGGALGPDIWCTDEEPVSGDC